MRFTNNFDLICVFERVRVCVCDNEKVIRVQGERKTFYGDCTFL